VKGFWGSNFGFKLASKESKTGFFWVRLASVWVRFGFVFFTIVNNDGQSLASFFQKKYFAGPEPEVRSQKPECGGASGMIMN
jgi:hypothetical protein